MAEVYKTNLPDAELLRTHFINEGRLALDVAMRIVKECTALLRSEPTMLDVPAPITGAIMQHFSAYLMHWCSCIQLHSVRGCAWTVLRSDEAV